MAATNSTMPLAAVIAFGRPRCMASYTACCAEALTCARRGTPARPCQCMPSANSIMPVNHHHTDASATRGDASRLPVRCGTSQNITPMNVRVVAVPTVM